MGCIYKITNKINGKSYVGLTSKTAEVRFKKHVFDAFSAQRPFAIHLAMNKYGIENFELETIFNSDNLEELNYQECLFIVNLNTLWPNGYNLITGGNARSGCSELTLARMSEAQKGKKQSEKTRNKRSIALLNKKKSKEDVERRAKSRSRAVTELTTGLKFPSVNKAAEFFNIKAKGISKNLHQKSSRYFDMKFEFTKKVE